jgi:hypothetical protein
MTTITIGLPSPIQRSEASDSIDYVLNDMSSPYSVTSLPSSATYRHLLSL